MIQVIKPHVSTKKISPFYSEFTIEPLERGFGYTFGNSLRRILLSSLPGVAITSIRVEGVSHEFSTLKGVREDINDVIMNLKCLILRLDSKEPVTLELEVKGPKKLKAKEIKVPSGVEIINPDLHIATLNKGGFLKMEATVEKGRGYASAERNKRPNAPIGVIAIDSIFSPVKRVTYSVENTRVGQRTDYDKLILKVETNGSVEPQEAIALAARLMKEHLDIFVHEAVEETESVFSVAEEKEEKVLNTPIEDLDLSARSYNCLKRKNVDTLGQLLSYSEAELLSMKNFGMKSINEVKSKLEKLNLSLAQS